jgi:hypothetical protein
MIPKEKAEELVYKYYTFGINNIASPSYSLHECKQLALIAVDEILDTIKWCIGDSQVEYWQEVKQEIEKL